MTPLTQEWVDKTEGDYMPPRGKAALAKIPIMMPLASTPSSVLKSIQRAGCWLCPLNLLGHL